VPAFTHPRDPDGRRVPLKAKRSRRVLEATPRLVTLLREHKIAAPASAQHDLVFTTRTGSGHDHRNIGGWPLARAVKRAGLEAVRDHRREIALPAPTFHDLRHTHAGAQIAQARDIQEVSARLGHADVGTTHRTYVHAFDAARRSDERRDRLANLYRALNLDTPGEPRRDVASARPKDAARPRPLCDRCGEPTVAQPCAPERCCKLQRSR
jgi:integrase